MEKEMNEISFEVSSDEAKVIAQIAHRAFGIARQVGIPYSGMDASMDLTACHANGCPLLLHSLLEADDANFTHDVFGIRRHLNRETGKLEDCFVPRFASKIAA